jgi:flavin reductase (DIM6/NTAB) family NADH-FMN oxidoreductase RutF
MTVPGVKDAYERVIEPVDPVAVLSHRNHTYRVALAAEELIVHLLMPVDLPLAELFGGVSGLREDKFTRVPWSDRDGTPLLQASGGWLRGRILSRGPAREETGGDHTCFVLEPTAAEGGGGISGPLRLSDVRHIQPGQPSGG